MYINNSMIRMLKYFFIIFLFSFNSATSKENFFEKAKTLYDEGKFDESKFLFQRNIVFNPKDSNSYLYLAKIYEVEKKEKEKEKNLNITLLLDSDNEDAMLMLIDLKLEKSDYKKVKELTKKFKIICSSLCDKTKSIQKRLENIEVNSDS